MQEGRRLWGFASLQACENESVTACGGELSKWPCTHGCANARAHNPVNGEVHLVCVRVVCACACACVYVCVHVWLHVWFVLLVLRQCVFVGILV